MKRDPQDRLRAELLRAAAAQAPRKATWWRWGLGPLAAVFAIAIAGVAVAGVLGVAAPDDPDDPPLRSKTFTVPARELSPAVRRRYQQQRNAQAPITDARRFFAVLRNPTRADRVRRPKYTYVRGYRGARGAIYVRATDRETCWLYQRKTTSRGFSTSCHPTATIGKRGGFIVEQCNESAAHPQHRRLAGIVPDGVEKVTASRAGVEQARASVSRNSFVLATDEPIDTVLIGKAKHRLPPVGC